MTPGGPGTPPDRQFTHTSAAHHTHSRIDLFLLPTLDCLLISHVSILPRGLSDHSPLSLRIGEPQGGIRPIWRLNAWFLQDERFKEALGLELHHFFQTNCGLVPSPDVVWEPGKATLRGVARGLVYAGRAEQTARLTRLEAQATRLEMVSATAPTARSSRLLMALRDEIQHISLESAKALWRSSVARVYR